MTRTGKIARLPREVREQLNGRLGNGEKGRLLVKWLNTLPAVQSVMAAEFGGKAVSERNLSEWKGGGYQDWLRERESLAEMRRILAEGSPLDGPNQKGLADHLSFWMTARYLLAARKLGNDGGEMEFKALRALCHDLVALRRTERYAERLDLARKRREKEDLLSSPPGRITLWS